MAKQEREVERWITVKGARVPIFKGQSVEEAIKESIGNRGKKKADEKKIAASHKEQEKSQYGSFKPGTQLTGIDNAKDQVDMLKKELKKHPDDIHTAEIKQRLAKAQAAYKKFQQGKDGYADKENFKTAKEWAGQEKRFTADDMSSKDLDDAPIGSKVSFEGETWKKTGKDTWRNSRNGEEWSGRDVYRQRIEGEEDMEVKLSAPSKASEQINSKGTMSPEELSKAENRRDKLWNKQDHGKITDAEKKELRGLEKSISDHYATKKADGGENKLSGKSTEQLQEIKKNLEAGAKITGTSQGTAKQLAEINKELEGRKTNGHHAAKKAGKADGGEKGRLGTYRRQLKDVQDDIEQFESTPKSQRSPDFDKKLGELKKKEKDLKGWIDNDVNALRNESIKEKQLAANKQQASQAKGDGWTAKHIENDLIRPGGNKASDVRDYIDYNHRKGHISDSEKTALLKKLDSREKASQVSKSQQFLAGVSSEAEIAQKLHGMTPTQRNALARSMNIGGRGKDREAALATALSNRYDMNQESGRGKRGSTPEFKSYNEAKEYYQKRFAEMSPQNMNRIARNMQIGGRGKEKIAALAEAKANEWQGKNGTGEQKYTVTGAGKDMKSFNNPKDADDYVSKQVKAGNGVASDYNIKAASKADAGAKKDRMQAAANKLGHTYGQEPSASEYGKFLQGIHSKYDIDKGVTYAGGALPKALQGLKTGDYIEVTPPNSGTTIPARYEKTENGFEYTPLGGDSLANPRRHLTQAQAEDQIRNGVTGNRVYTHRLKLNQSTVSKESAGAMSNVYDGGKKIKTAGDMTESELRSYVKKNGLTKQYNIMMNMRSGGYDYQKQVRVLRDLVSDDMQKTVNKKRKK